MTAADATPQDDSTPSRGLGPAPDTPPWAVVVTGLAGSGKSTLSRSLARALGAARLDKDTMVTPLTELLLAAHDQDPQQRESSPFYLDHVFPAEYRALLAVARDCLDVGTPVVIDAPFFAHLADADYLTRASADAGWPAGTRTLVVWLTAHPDTLRARMTARALDRDRWKLDHWDDYWAAARDLRCAWRGVDVVTVGPDTPHDSATGLPRPVAESLRS